MGAKSRRKANFTFARFWLNLDAFAKSLKSVSAKFKEAKFKRKIADKARKYANGAGRQFAFVLALNLAALAKS